MAQRVLHVGKFFPPYRGGMEVFLADLLQAQRAQGIDAAALVHGDPLPDDPPWLVRVPVQGQLVYAPIAMGFRAALAQAITRFRPDVLHLHMPNNSALWALTLPQAHSIPWVVHWHSDVVVSEIRLSVAAAYALYRPFEQAVLDRAERIISTSQPYLDASSALRPWRSKCAVIPLGIDCTIPPMPEQLPERLQWHGDTRLRLLSIGRLTYYKGFETLVEAVQALPGVELLIAGDGELQADLQARIHAATPAGQRPATRLLGDVSDGEKHALLQQCDTFCLASRERTEAFGVVLLEAMLHAKPCIVTDLPGSGMPWVVALARAGLRVPIEDIAGWRSALTRLQHDPALRKQLGRAGQQAMGLHFGIEACTRAIDRQYLLANSMPVAQKPPQRGTLVTVTTCNQAARIQPLLASLQAQGLHDILVIDQRSTDGTCSLAEAAGAQVLRPPLAMAPWTAVQTGLRYALAHGYSGALTLDAGSAHDLAAIPALIARASSADLVIGSAERQASARRQLAWRWFRQLAGFDLRDLTSGYRYYSRTAMAVLATREATLLDHHDLGALLLAQRAGLRMAEVQVQAPPAGMPVRRSWRAMAMYLASTTLLCLAHIRPLRRQRAASP